MLISRRFINTRRAPTTFIWLIYVLCLNASAAATPTVAQQKNKKGTDAETVATAPALTRTTTRHEVRRFGYGSTLTIIGAPAGSITIEAWSRSEVDVTADIELRAGTEEELARLAVVNSFLIDEEPNHLRILTTGTHDKAFMKRVAKKFPKNLLGLPWKIDYRIRVPALTDLEINVGRGAFSLTGVEGAISFTAIESDANLTLTGGQVSATVGSGSLNITLAARNWRGRGAEFRLATGTLTLELPTGFSADLNADILRSGQIENSYPQLEPLERTTMTPRSIKARAGAGGPTLVFTVGDGTLRIKQVGEAAK